MLNYKFHSKTYGCDLIYQHILMKIHKLSTKFPLETGLKKNK